MECDGFQSCCGIRINRVLCRRCAAISEVPTPCIRVSGTCVTERKRRSYSNRCRIRREVCPNWTPYPDDCICTSYGIKVPICAIPDIIIFAARIKRKWDTSSRRCIFYISDIEIKCCICRSNKSRCFGFIYDGISEIIMYSVRIY